MKGLLCALNAKYTHTALGIRSLAAYAASAEVTVVDYTINQTQDVILKDIFQRQPEFVGFSCYIWNIGMVLSLVDKVKTVLPECTVFLGGPEVSYDGAEILAENPGVDFIMMGEGERPFRLFLEGQPLACIPGVVTRQGETLQAAPVPLDDIPFVYTSLEGLEHRILYYETQRGCPFSCQYCLSSVEKGIRFLSMERVQADLQFFLDQRVMQVKFIDRTFNCNKNHAMAIWQYLIDHDNGVTNFHMELAAHLLDEEVLALLSKARKGLFQFEIGVQTTNPPTLKAIERAGAFSDIAHWVTRVREMGNIHQHLDLIAGLPFESYQEFATSFDDVYALGMEQLQLGFLKLLKGSGLREKAKDYGICYSRTAPYEVLSTPKLPYKDVLRLKFVEDMVETFYNSGKARNTIRFAVEDFGSPFRFYEALGGWWEKQGYFEKAHSKEGLFTNLYAFVCATSKLKAKKALYQDLIKLDMLSGDRLSRLPAWMLPEDAGFQERRRAFYNDKENIAAHLPHLAAYTPAQLGRMCYLGAFAHDVLGDGQEKNIAVLFDYHSGGEVRLVELEGFYEKS